MLKKFSRKTKTTERQILELDFAYISRSNTKNLNNIWKKLFNHCLMINRFKFFYNRQKNNYKKDVMMKILKKKNKKKK